jgi:N-methylhydantoinase B/oxoprolinase/acetone carboxylase alpha subunit
MPPLSKALVEEGAAIIGFKLVEKGVFQVRALDATPCVSASRLSGFFVCIVVVDD